MPDLLAVDNLLTFGHALTLPLALLSGYKSIAFELLVSLQACGQPHTANSDLLPQALHAENCSLLFSCLWSTAHVPNAGTGKKHVFGSKLR